MTRESIAREEICRVGASLYAGCAHATAGNVSVRLSADDGGGFLITSTDACLGLLDPAKLAKLDAQGQHVSGDRASKTIRLHQRISRASEAAGFAAAACCTRTAPIACLRPWPMRGGRARGYGATCCRR